jgi:hypothetical protein
VAQCARNMSGLKAGLYPAHALTEICSNTQHHCRCVVIEDSNIGVRAARAAGMRCVVTVSSYTRDEDFKIADAVFDCIEGNFTIDDLTTPGEPLPFQTEHCLIVLCAFPGQACAVLPRFMTMQD